MKKKKDIQESVKEPYRDEQGLPVLDSLVRDVRYGIRALLRSPGFTLVAVVSLALGIGANTTIFSVANAVLYRALPFDDPDRLVVIYEAKHETGTIADTVALDRDRVAGAGTVVRPDRGYGLVCRGKHAVGRGNGGARQDTVSYAGCVCVARYQTGARSGFYPRGCRSREPLRDHQRRVVAAPIWRRPWRPRADNPSGRQAAADRRRDAGWRLDRALAARR